MLFLIQPIERRRYVHHKYRERIGSSSELHQNWPPSKRNAQVGHRFQGFNALLVISPAPLAKEPNEETLEAFRELEEIRKDPSHRTHEDADELFAALGI